MKCIYCHKNYAITESFRDGVILQEGCCNCQGSKLNTLIQTIKVLHENILSYKSISDIDTIELLSQKKDINLLHPAFNKK